MIAVVDETVKTTETTSDDSQVNAADSTQVGGTEEAVTTSSGEEHSAAGDVDAAVAESVVEESVAEEQTLESADTEPAETEIVETESDDVVDVPPVESIDEQPEEDNKKRDWYILKVQVNRESSICDALRRRVKVEGLEEYFGEILVPTEDVREFTKTGKQRVVKRKLYPGYIVVNMAINDDTWFAVRETPGIGDFTGSAGKPTPMLTHEIDRILKAAKPDEDDEQEIKTTIKFKQGDRVRVKDGHFENFEGEIDTVDETHGRVTVMINIFGRPTPVELEHWQVEDV